MLDVYIVGLFVIGGIMGLVTVAGTLVSFIERDKDIARVTAVIFTSTLIGVWFWPIIIAVALLCGVAYSLFTTARFVRHRSLDF